VDTPEHHEVRASGEVFAGERFTARRKGDLAMVEPGKPNMPSNVPAISSQSQPAQQLPLPGIPQPGMLLQGRFVAAAQYASLELSLCTHLFPNRPLFQLSQDERRMLLNETDILLLQARWRIESRWFAEHFAQPQTGVEMAPAGTILGEKPGAPVTEAASTGQYL
jgi:hypothetical protein